MVVVSRILFMAVSCIDSSHAIARLQIGISKSLDSLSLQDHFMKPRAVGPPVNIGPTCKRFDHMSIDHCSLDTAILMAVIRMHG